jgi:hypothetical protein
MKNSIEAPQQSRNEWSTPELKKIAIEQITAAGQFHTTDAKATHHS